MVTLEKTENGSEYEMGIKERGGSYNIVIPDTRIIFAKMCWAVCSLTKSGFHRLRYLNACAPVGETVREH